MVSERSRRSLNECGPRLLILVDVSRFSHVTCHHICLPHCRVTGLQVGKGTFKVLYITMYIVYVVGESCASRHHGFRAVRLVDFSERYFLLTMTRPGNVFHLTLLWACS